MEKNRIISVVALLLVGNLYLANIGLYNYRTSPAVLFGALVIFTLSAYYFFKNKKIIYRCGWQLYLIMAIGVSYLISGILYKSPAYLVYGCVFIFQLPFYYVTVLVEDKREWIYKFSCWNIIFFTLVLIITLTCCPLKGGQYSGIFNNPNLWGEILSTTLVLLLYVIEKNQKLKTKHFIGIIMIICILNIIFTASRTAMLATVLIFAIYIRYKVQSLNINVKKVICAILIICIVSPLTYFGLKYVTPDETERLQELGLVTEEQENTNTGLITMLEGRYLKGITDEGSFSSGRTLIWREYINELSVVGHKPESLLIGNGDNVNRQNAHNAFIQVGYEAGIIAMFMLMILVINIAYNIIKKIVSKHISILDFFLISGFLVAIVYMMLSSEYSPYNSFAILIFWLFTVPIILQNNIKSYKRNI